MSDPLVLTLKATDKAGLVKNLRLGASLGWEVRYVMDRDNARLLADAIEACLEIEANTEKTCSEAIGRLAALRDEALAANADTIKRLKANIRVQIMQMAFCVAAIAALWWAA